jgi:uncharacterized protein (DUF1778 family)
MAVKTKGARLDIRLTTEQKELFEYVATLEGKKLSELLIFAMQQYAMSAIEEHEELNRILSSKRDQKIFVQELKNPSNPNEQLIKAAEKYKNLFK